MMKQMLHIVTEFASRRDSVHDFVLPRPEGTHTQARGLEHFPANQRRHRLPPFMKIIHRDVKPANVFVTATET